MRIKQKIRIYVDFAMILLMPCLMAYSLIGGKIHEWLGMAMFLLFFVHHLLNLGWYRAMIKGHYTAPRIVRTAVNMLLLIVMVLLAVKQCDYVRICTLGYKRGNRRRCFLRIIFR